MPSRRRGSRGSSGCSPQAKRDLPSLPEPAARRSRARPGALARRHQSRRSRSGGGRRCGGARRPRARRGRDGRTRAPPAPTSSRRSPPASTPGRYGVFENDRDYDIRGRRGPALAAVRQCPCPLRAGRRAGARRRGPCSAGRGGNRARRRDRLVRRPGARAALEALEAAYIASRRSRDVIAERFRAARGTLFDVVEAENSLFRGGDSLHPGVDRIGRGPLRPTIPHRAAARDARHRCRPPARSR